MDCGSLLIVSVGSRFPLERGRVLRAVAVHLPLSAVVIAGQILVISHVADAFGFTSTSPRALYAAAGRDAATRDAATRSTGSRQAARGDSLQTAVGSAPIAPRQPLGMESRLALGLRQYSDLLIVVYCAVVGAQAAVRWNRRWREESLRNARLGEDLAQASLQALRAQLNPHFLFSALNSIGTLKVASALCDNPQVPRVV